MKNMGRREIFKMKKHIPKMFFLIIVLLCMFMNNNYLAYATDEELDLNTEVLKNRQENYSSLTDINGINLFTDKMMEKVNAENIEKEKQELKYRQLLFYEMNEKRQESKKDIELLFNEPVSFNNKIETIKKKNIYIEVLLVVMTVIGSVFVVFGVKKTYKSKGEDEYEYNFDFH